MYVMDTMRAALFIRLAQPAYFAFAAVLSFFLFSFFRAPRGKTKTIEKYYAATGTIAHVGATV
jgi:hypothetical protein